MKDILNNNEKKKKKEKTIIVYFELNVFKINLKLFKFCSQSTCDIFRIDWKAED